MVFVVFVFLFFFKKNPQKKKEEKDREMGRETEFLFFLLSTEGVSFFLSFFLVEGRRGSKIPQMVWFMRGVRGVFFFFFLSCFVKKKKKKKKRLERERDELLLLFFFFYFRSKYAVSFRQATRLVAKILQMTHDRRRIVREPSEKEKKEEEEDESGGGGDGDDDGSNDCRRTIRRALDDLERRRHLFLETAVSARSRMDFPQNRRKVEDQADRIYSERDAIFVE